MPSAASEIFLLQASAGSARGEAGGASIQNYETGNTNGKQATCSAVPQLDDAAECGQRGGGGGGGGGGGAGGGSILFAEESSDPRAAAAAAACAAADAANCHIAVAAGRIL